MSQTPEPEPTALREQDKLTGDIRDSGGTAAISSEELFAGRREIEILHDGECYRLRITRNGKLILHK